MQSDEKRVSTIGRDGGEPLPTPIAALVERWITRTDGDPVAALVIAAEELTLMAPGTSRGFSRLPPIERRARIGGGNSG